MSSYVVLTKSTIQEVVKTISTKNTVDYNIRQQMNEELGEEPTQVERSMLAQKYGLNVLPVNDAEVTLFENRVKREEKNERRYRARS